MGKRKRSLSSRKYNGRTKKSREGESQSRVLEDNSVTDTCSSADTKKDDLVPNEETVSLEATDNNTVQTDGDNLISNISQNASHDNDNSAANDEFVFTPISSSQESSVSQPQACSSSSTEVCVSISSQSVSVIVANQKTSNSSGITSTSSVEIIDVDDLPDIPDSPIGDDVIEILPAANINHSSEVTRQSFVDLTENESSTSNSPDMDDGDIDEGETSNFALYPLQLGKPNLVSMGLTSISTSPSHRKDDSKSSSQSKINCPICMDDYNQMLKDGKQLTSTPCGHVFCDECIRAAVKRQKRCPTCRKKLLNGQLHPLFL